MADTTAKNRTHSESEIRGRRGEEKRENYDVFESRATPDLDGLTDQNYNHHLR
jgi:hypothetical protein